MKRVTANQYFSKYILLRDAIEDVEESRLSNDSLFEYVLCRTCGKPLPRIGSNSQAGHFVPKGNGGKSGVYYDERNVHCQCYNCNEWLEGNRLEYNDYMLRMFGQDVIDELRLKDKLPRPHKIDEYGIMYREKLKELKKKYGLKR
jgi:hypothetical protein